MSRQQTRKRPWLAAVLAFLQPGLGHVYLRAWTRALVWFGLWVMTVVLVVPLPAAQAGDPAGVFAAAFRAFGSLSVGAALALFSVAAVSTLDAYWLAARFNQYADTARCPHCGKEIDESLEFCHWCTEPLDDGLDDALDDDDRAVTARRRT